MSIASEITRLQSAKADLKTAIEGKGVTVASDALLDDYADLVDDIPTGGGGIKTGTVTLAERATSITIDIGASSFSGLVVVPKSETPLKSGGKTFIGCIITPNDFYKSIMVTSNSSGSGVLTPAISTTESCVRMDGNNATVWSSKTGNPSVSAGSFEAITYEWFVW